MPFTPPVLKGLAPVQPNQVWEYGPGYYRSGRFIVKRKIPADLSGKIIGAVDLWECIETVGGADRKMTEDDILKLAALTRIQPGQVWEDGERRICRITRPEIVRFDGTSWKFTRADTGDIEQDDYEHRILSTWTQIMGDVGRGGGATCPLCGGHGFQGFTHFDCANSACRNHQPKATP